MPVPGVRTLLARPEGVLAASAGGAETSGAPGLAVPAPLCPPHRRSLSKASSDDCTKKINNKAAIEYRRIALGLMATIGARMPQPSMDGARLSPHAGPAVRASGSLRKQPVFTLVAVLTLTLGIGANTAIFSLLYQILLRPLPYPNADRLVFVWNSYPGINLDQASVSIPDYLDRKTQAPAIEDATLFTNRTANLNEGGNPEQLRALAVTPSFFSTLQRQPFLGRGFTEDEAKPDADKFAILTYGLWTSHYGADRAIVGRDIRVNGVAHRVVGVLPADFELPARDIALLVPFSFTPAQMSDNARGNEFSQMIARLRPGATIAQLNAQMQDHRRPHIERLPARAAFAKSSGFGGFAVSHPRSARRRRPPAAATCCRSACCWCCSSPAPTSPT